MYKSCIAQHILHYQISYVLVSKVTQDLDHQQYVHVLYPKEAQAKRGVGSNDMRTRRAYWSLPRSIVALVGAYPALA